MRLGKKTIRSFIVNVIMVFYAYFYYDKSIKTINFEYLYYSGCIINFEGTSIDSGNKKLDDFLSEFFTKRVSDITLGEDSTELDLLAITKIPFIKKVIIRSKIIKNLDPLGSVNAEEVIIQDMVIDAIRVNNLMQELHVERSHIKDYNFLLDTSNIRKLVIIDEENKFNDFTILKNNSSLNILMVNCDVLSLEGLSSLTNLEKLSIVHGKFKNLEELRNLKQLKSLGIFSVENIHSLLEMNQLLYLSILKITKEKEEILQKALIHCKINNQLSFDKVWNPDAIVLADDFL